MFVMSLGSWRDPGGEAASVAMEPDGVYSDPTHGAHSHVAWLTPAHVTVRTVPLHTISLRKAFTKKMSLKCDIFPKGSEVLEQQIESLVQKY